MRVLLIAFVSAAVAAVGWVALGRQLALLLDWVSTVPAAMLPVSPIFFPNGTLHIGDRAILVMTAGIDVRSDDGGRLVLSTGGKSFPLGQETAQEIVPEAGDLVSYTIEHSRLSWPTPFEWNFMTGHSPSWKRHLYHKLLWKKADGAKLEIVCRYEQWFYGSNQWSGLGGMTSLYADGAWNVKITP